MTNIQTRVLQINSTTTLIQSQLLNCMKYAVKNSTTGADASGKY